MKKRTLFLAMMAIILVCCMSVAGVLAYMTNTTAHKVTNTFVSSGGLIDTTPDDEADEGEDVPDPADPTASIKLDPGFKLFESYAAYDGTTNTYKLENKHVIANTYNNVTSDMGTLPKDPTLVVDLKEGAKAYIFISVENQLDDSLTATISDDWTVLKDGAGNPVKIDEGKTTVYVYKNGAVQEGQADAGVGETPTYTYIVSHILDGDKITVANTEELDSTLGSISFKAYVSQADGFENAYDSFCNCFMAD